MINDYQDELVKNGVFGSPTPLIGSHEGAGIIQALGDDVSGKLAVGDRVAALLYRDPCGKCEPYDVLCASSDLTALYSCREVSGLQGWAADLLRQYQDERLVSLLSESPSLITDQDLGV